MELKGAVLALLANWIYVPIKDGKRPDAQYVC